MTINLHGVRLSRAGHPVLEDMSLSISAGEVVGILGENGAGKSTLIDAIAGEIHLDGGQVTISGQALAGLSVSQQSRLRAVLPQKPSLSFDMTVAEVVRMGAYPFTEVSPDAVDAWTAQSLSWTDLKNFGSRRYLELSGGEQQRVQLARVLVQGLAIAASGETPFFLLDEPSAGLDARHQIELMRCLRTISTQYRAGVIVALHDINLAARWCDRVVLLAEGRVVSQGTPAEALTPEALRRTFGIEMVVIPHPCDSGCLLVLDRVTC